MHLRYSFVTKKIDSISSFAPQLCFVDSHSQGDKKTGFKFKIKLDISVYHNTLGNAIPTGCDSSLLDMHIEFKLYNFENPFTCPPSENRDQIAFIGPSDNQQDTLGQIETYAAAQLISQFRTHCFSLFILYDTARIIQWDREGAVITEPIPYNTDSSLVEFFSQYSQAPPELRGIDTTISIAPPDEATRARNALGFSGTPPMFKTIIPGNRDGPPLTIIFPRPEGRPSSPACRGTRTCRAYDLFGDRVVYFKESWHIDATDIVPEGEIYANLNAKGVSHVPICLASGDVPCWSQQKTQTFRYSWFAWACQQGLAIIRHSHYFLSIDIVGDALTNFSSSRALVQAIHDALIGEFFHPNDHANS